MSSSTQLVLLAAGACALTTACKKTVNTEGFEKTITERVLAMGLTPGKVNCPKGIEAKADATFTCSVEIEGVTYELDVSIEGVDSNAKRVNLTTAWKRGNAVRAKKLATEVPPRLETQLGAKVAMDCGREPLLFLDAARAVACTITAGKASSTLRLTFSDKLDVTDWKLEPPLLGRHKLEQILTPSVQAKTGPDVKVDCGPDDLVRRPDDGIVWCAITDGKQNAKVKVAITPALTVERWEVAKPSP